jgi:glycosyltransferase involved in cell wall biosynthesis
MRQVAIIMPYYNEADLLRKSVWGIFNQTHKDWHLFLIDDGSKRGSRAYEVLNIPPQFEKQITIVYKSNGGVSSARNQAINMIVRDPSGRSFDYIAYCDSDDIWPSSYLEEQVKALLQGGDVFKEYDMVYAAPDHKFVDGNKAIPYGIADYPDFPGSEMLIKGGNCIFISGVVHKAEILSKIGFFDWELNSIEDWDYWVRISQAGYKILKNPDTTFIYTVKMNGNGSKSNKEVYEKFYKKHNWFK